MIVLVLVVYKLKFLILFFIQIIEKCFEEKELRDDFILVLNRKIFEMGSLGRQ